MLEKILMQREEQYADFTALELDDHSQEVA